MKNYREVVFVLLFLYLLTVLWAIASENNKPYKTYQRIYQAKKLEQLRVKVQAEQAPDQKEEVLAQIRWLRESLPGLQEVTLKNGSRERCITCHIGIEQISDSHPLDTFGCTICHGGDPLSVALPAAHSGLIGGRNPSDFRVVDQGCGSAMPDGTACHTGDPAEERDHIYRTQTTIMATKAGEIAHPRFAFGAQKSLRALYGVAAIQGREPKDEDKTTAALLPLPYTRKEDLPADDQGRVIRTDATGALFTFSEHRVDTPLHRNCVNQCHLWSKGREEIHLSRASGCASCHYLYDGSAYYRGDDPKIPRDEPGHGSFHRLTLKIPYSQCDHCHNRWAHSLINMGFVARKDPDEKPAQGLSADEHRLRDYYNPMTLFTLCEYKLDCIDCHTVQEVMGDGFLYHDKIAQQRIRCYTCHGTLERPPDIRKLTGQESPKVQRIMRIYSRKAGEDALFSDQGEIFPHIRIKEGRIYLIGKETGKEFYLPQIYGSKCKQNPKAQDANSCHACHDIHLKPQI